MRFIASSSSDETEINISALDNIIALSNILQMKAYKRKYNTVSVAYS